MATHKRVDFYSSEEGTEAYQLLKAMEADENFITRAGYAADSEKYPDNLISFVEKHMNYLNTHPNTDMRSYIANLRLMSRVRR